MNGRQFAVALFILACLAALIFSYVSWKQKLASKSGNEVEMTGLERPLAGITTAPEVQEADDSNEDSAQLTASELAALSANMDEELASLLATRFEAGENVNLLIAGSQAIAQGGNGGAVGKLVDSLLDTYEGFIETEIISFAGTSAEFVEEMDDLIDFGAYDAILLESFTLNNNGLVVIEDEHRHILQIQDTLLEAKEDAVLLLMPSQPIYRPNFYATQIRSLESFAAGRGIPFINHWTSWPDVTDTELLEYLDASSAPNELGADAWGNALREYFISRGE